MSSLAIFNNLSEAPKLQELHTSPYYEQKEKRKRSHSEMSVDSGYSADSPMDLGAASPEPQADHEASTAGTAWGMFKSREIFVEMHIC